MDMSMTLLAGKSAAWLLCGVVVTLVNAVVAFVAWKCITKYRSLKAGPGLRLPISKACAGGAMKTGMEKGRKAMRGGSGKGF